MKSRTIKIASLLLSVVMLIPLAAGCGNNAEISGSQNDEKNEGFESSLNTLRENYPPIYEALLCYFWSEDGELTEDMLAQVKYIDIERSLHSHTKEEYSLYDVYINRDKNYGGVLERRMTAKRFDKLYGQMKDNDAPLTAVNRLNMAYLKKDVSEEGLLEVIAEEMLLEYPECKEIPIYVLHSELTALEVVQLIEYISKYTDTLDKKALKNDTVLNSEILRLFPNLKALKLRGIEIDCIPENINVTQEKHVDTLKQLGFDDIAKLDIQNKHCTYTLTRVAENGGSYYCINGDSDSYDQEKLRYIYSIFMKSYSQQFSSVTDEEIKRIKNDPYTVRVTVTLKDGKEYTMHISTTENALIYDGDSRKYSFMLRHEYSHMSEITGEPIRQLHSGINCPILYDLSMLTENLR